MAATVTPEPIYIGEHALVAKFFVLVRNPGDPRRIEGTFTIVGDDATLTLDAIVGPKGNPGQPSPIIRPQWGSTVTEVGDLPDVITLDDTDRGRAWYINGFWHVYDRDEDDDDDPGQYYVVQGSIAGPKGDTPAITVSAEVIDAEGSSVYGPIDVEPTGTTLARNFHLKIPGVPGPEGPASAIENALDYDGPPAEVGQILAKLTDDTWGASDALQVAVEKYSLPHSSFIDYPDGGATRRLIGSLNIPARPFDWYSEVAGHIRLQRSLLGSAQVEVEVRVGVTGASSGETEELCGLGPFDPVWTLLDSQSVVTILDHYSDVGQPTRAISPDSSAGRLLAGNPYTFYVFLHKLGGSGNYSFSKANAVPQLRVNVCRAPEL